MTRAGTAERVGAAATPLPGAPRRTGRSDGFVARIGALVDSRGWRIGLRVVGMLLFAYTAMVAIFGQDLEINPIFGVFYVWWWVGLVPFSLLFGKAWKAISPVRTINAGINWLRRDDEGLYPYDEVRFGYWPAIVGLLVYVFRQFTYERSARVADRLFHLHDTISSYLHFSRAGRNDGFYKLQAEQTRKRVEPLDPSQIKYEFPRRGAARGPDGNPVSGQSGGRVTGTFTVPERKQ